MGICEHKEKAIGEYPTALYWPNPLIIIALSAI
jgi:hypothetical protein